MCFVWIWKQIAIISIHNNNWLVFITEAECLLRGTRWAFNYNTERVELWQVFSPSTRVSPVSIISPTSRTHLHLHVALTRKTDGWHLWTFKKQWFFFFDNRRPLDREVLLRFFRVIEARFSRVFPVSPCKCWNFWCDELKNSEMVSKCPSCCCMPLTQPSRI